MLLLSVIKAIILENFMMSLVPFYGLEEGFGLGIMLLF